MKETSANLKLISILAPIISSRDLIENLEKLILKTDSKTVNLDFEDVEFISRSAAHAMLRLKEDLQRKTWNKKEVSFINTNNEIRDMFRVVAANRAIPEEKAYSFKAKHVSIESLL